MFGSIPFFSTLVFDPLALVGAGSALLLGALALAGPSGATRPAPARPGLVVLATLLAVAMALHPSLSSLARLGGALVLVAALDAAAGLAAPRGWLILVAAGWPLLWLVDASLRASTGSSALGSGQPAPLGVTAALVLIGVGLTSLASLGEIVWLSVPDPEDAPTTALVADRLLPIGGFSLVARAITASPSPRSLLLLALLGASSVALLVGAAALARRGQPRPRDARVGALALAADWVGYATTGLALLLLAVGSPLSVGGALAGSVAPTVGLILIALGEVARARAERSGQGVILSARLDRGWAFDLLERSAGDVARVVRSLEERDELAVGFLVALVAVFVFAR